MSLDTATITGKLVRPDQSKWVVAAWIEVASEGGRATADGVAIGGLVPVTIASDGTATLPNPLIQIPQTGVEPAGARYRLSVQTTDGKTNAWEFELTTDTTWDQIITTANVPVTSSIQAAAEAAQQAAEDAADRAEAAALDAVELAKAGYDVILLAGQSNMQGADNTSDSTIDTADSRIFEYALSGTHTGTIQPATEPLHHLHGAGAVVGPGLPFARWYAASNPNRKVLLVPCALGGSGFEASTSSPNARWKVGRVQSGEINLYDETVAAANAAIAAGGAGTRIAAVLWCQGEADGSTAAATYQADLLALIDGLRANITGATNVPFVLLSMAPSGLGASNRAPINAVHVDVPYLREYGGYTLGLSGHDNGIHYDATAQRYNGSVALAAAFVRAVTNRIGVAPVAPTDVKVAQDVVGGTTATVTWTAALGRKTDYTVQYRLADGDTWTTLTRARSLVTSVQLTGLAIGNYLEVRVLTVNEAGTSGPSTSARCPILPAPNLSISQGSTGVVNVSASAVPGALGYRFDYKLSTDSAWTAGTTGTGTTASISGLTTASYDFRVVVFTPIGAVVGNAASFTPSAVSIVASSLTAVVAQAYGPRRVLSTWSGALIRVRRSSDNTESDIGIASGTISLDTAALLTFAGAGDAFITKIYDQSGNGRDMVQSTAAAQPKIVSAGVVLSNNGRPGMDFDGTDDYVERSAAEFWSSGSGTICGVASGTLTANTQEAVFAEGGTGSNNARYIINKCSNGGLGFNVVSDTSSTDVLTQDLSYPVTDNPTFGSTTTQWSVVDSGTNITRYRGGSSMPGNGTQTNPTYSRSGKTLTLNRQAIGALHRLAVTTFAKFRLSELVIFNTAASTADRQFVENNQKAYYGTPTGL